MFERFTKKARQAIVEAEAEAASLGHDFIGTEHLLLGLLRSDGVAAHVLTEAGVTSANARAAVAAMIGRGGVDEGALATLGIDLEAIRRSVEAEFGEGAFDRVIGRRACNRRPFTPRSKKVLELSLREALSMKHGYIGTEHVLLAIVREGKGVAAQVLRQLAPDVDVRAAVVARLRQAS